MDERAYNKGTYLRTKVLGSIPSLARKFSTPDCKKIIKASSVRAIVICRDYLEMGSDPTRPDHPLTRSKKGAVKYLLIRPKLKILGFFGKFSRFRGG